MDTHDTSSKGLAHQNHHSSNNNIHAPPNPPSIEAAYKRKCIELKKRLNEVEASNDAMRIRNAQGHRYIQKMRLESCMLLERLAVLTGMAEEQGISTELRARTVALLKEMEPGYGPAPANRLGGAEAGASASAGTGGAGGVAGVKRASYGIDYMDDGTEGSSEGHPPTPQERPLRVKRSRRMDDSSGAFDTPEKDMDHHHNLHSALPPLLPASTPINNNNHDLDSRIKHYNPSAQPPLAPSPALESHQPHHSVSPNHHNHHRHHRHRSNGSYNHGPAPEHQQQPQQPHRYVSAFEDFTNRTRDKVLSDLVEAYGPETNITNDDVDRALAEHWESLDPATKRTYGDWRESL
ncbi:hypothetical protein AJ79_05766 [Helicocarpus griseus UAMH5409]|uniref:HMG box domain-containing protein n=1 Tax=Helicocarpus griseus UAMH5409 TaxID=1447875 RepID=A0A2B7XKD0_9EURO|nr:hypothetical protein AJ79_05766 [Helicocarpus griseus UAMH5409]